MDPRTPDRPADVLEPCSASCAAPCSAPAGPSRRRVLALAALAGAGGAALVACGGGSSGAAGGSSGSAADPSGSSGAGGASGELVATSKVPVKGGVILDGPKIVVTQPTAGTFKAFTAICTHMNCTVGAVADNVISCPCHGSAYSAEDGSVRNGPATRPLAAIPITVTGGAVVKS